MTRPPVLIQFALLCAGCLSGCNRTPSIAPPEFQPGKIAGKAMEMYDKDSDGFLTKSELEVAPGLLDGIPTIDKDSDGKLSEAEIAGRIEALVASRNACQLAVCQFLQGNKPIADAEITLEPEPFMGDVIVAATGTTDQAGRTELQCPATPLGMQPGFYRVRVSKLAGGSETIPEKYNKSTVLGAEISGLTKGDKLGCYVFKLD